MNSIFITILRDGKQVLLNLSLVWKIEVSYGVPDPKTPGRTFSTGYEEGVTDLTTIKYYTLHIGSEAIMLRANPDDPVMKPIEAIYQSAIMNPIKRKGN